MQSIESLWWLFLIEFSIVILISFIAIPTAAKRFKASKIVGRNLNSDEKEELPESLGLIIGMIFLVITVLLSFFVNPYIDIVYTTLMTSLLALLLGFVDDILSIRWRYKILIPLIAAIPLIVNFTGSTLIEIPFIGLIELGLLYPFLIIPLVTIYMANSINIHAGVNLLEVGQVLVLSFVILIIGLIMGNIFSVYMVLPLIAGSIALGYYNKFPAKIFVGNSFTYFSGILLITIAVFANMERIVILCTIPQLINFVYSMRDLFGKTSRHRKPLYDEESGLMQDSGYHTLLNLILKFTGPIKEKKLSLIAIMIQIINAIIIMVSWILLISI